jgi:ubiquinone/menaquinone biosynthesis C-methylase UbiE
MKERDAFYRRTLARLLDAGALTREMSVLVVAGDRGDADVFRALEFGDVTISNLDERIDPDAFAPYRWINQDAEALTFDDGSFDFAVVSAGLHHCRSPHRALLEMYRVARRGLLALESRDSTAMRLASRLGLVPQYELTAVAANEFRAGGVANSAVPNFVYRWTEREVEKTIASFAPHARHRFLYFREFEFPESLVNLERDGVRAAALRTMRPLAAGVARVVPSQANLFAFAVLKPELPRDLQPWLRLGDEGVEPDEAYLRSRYREDRKSVV